MNAMKEKHVPQRNITPNFIRFKSNASPHTGKTSSGKPTTPEDPTK